MKAVNPNSTISSLELMDSIITQSINFDTKELRNELEQSVR